MGVIDKWVKEVEKKYKEGYSINIMVIGRARTGKSIFSFYIYDMLKNITKNSFWDMGLNIDLMRNENTTLFLDEVGFFLYRGRKREWKMREKLYKILLTSQIKHFILIMTSNFLIEVETIRRFLNYIILLQRRENKLLVVIYEAIQNNITGKVYVYEKYKTILNFEKVLKVYKKYQKEYEIKKNSFVNNVLNV